MARAVTAVITGANGFIARHLAHRLAERGDRVVGITRDTSATDRRAALAAAGVVFHLAGVNRPRDVADFEHGNVGVTAALCADLLTVGRPVPVVFSSSAQAERDNPYGRSKRAAEEELERYAAVSGAHVAILRLWNVFGPRARPNYNSAVATFCHNVARGLPIEIHDAAAPLRLVNVDDVVTAMLALSDAGVPRSGLVEVGPVRETTVGELAATIRGFAAGEEGVVPDEDREGLRQALLATYLGYRPT